MVSPMNSDANSIPAPQTVELPPAQIPSPVADPDNVSELNPNDPSADALSANISAQLSNISIFSPEVPNPNDPSADAYHAALSATIASLLSNIPIFSAQVAPDVTASDTAIYSAEVDALISIAPYTDYEFPNRVTRTDDADINEAVRLLEDNSNHMEELRRKYVTLKWKSKIVVGDISQLMLRFGHLSGARRDALENVVGYIPNWEAKDLDERETRYGFDFVYVSEPNSNDPSDDDAIDAEYAADDVDIDDQVRRSLEDSYNQIEELMRKNYNLTWKTRVAVYDVSQVALRFGHEFGKRGEALENVEGYKPDWRFTDFKKRIIEYDYADVCA